MTAARKVSKSCTSPILTSFIISFMVERTAGQRLSGTNAREQAEHFWP